MTYQVEELRAPNFRLLDELAHQNLMPFIRVQLERNKPVLYALNACMFLFMAFFFYFLLKDLVNGNGAISVQFLYFSYGVGLTFLLIPVHEYLHVLAYRVMGARNTYLDMNLQKFYFMALADQSVVNARQFRVVALTPFVTVSTISLILAIGLVGTWKLVALGLFLSHTVFCSGDFGLLSYLHFN